MRDGAAVSAARFLALAGGLLAAGGCESRAPVGAPPSTTSEVAGQLTRQQALDSATAFMRRSSFASHVQLDSTTVQEVDSIWRVTFKRRELVIPNVITVDVHSRTGAMRFPGDE